MSIFIVPISLIVKNYFEGLPYYLSQISVYLYTIFAIVIMLFGRKFFINRLVNIKAVIGLIVIILFQFLSMLISYQYIGNHELNLNPLNQIIKFIIFIITIYFYFIIISIIVQTQRDISNFFRGIFFSLVAVSIISYIQLFSILGIKFFDNIITLTASIFEQRSISGQAWYIEGSYSQTVGRINAIYQEAGFLASILLVVFTPFVLSSIKNQVSLFNLKIKYNKLLYVMLLINILILLFFIQSTTGLVAIILIVLLLLIELNFKNKGKIIALIIIGLLFLVYQYNQHGFIYETLNDLIFDKGENSTSNRLGGTIGLLLTWLQHFFLGIGWEYEGYYLFENVPVSTRDNWEYINVFVANGFYPILSFFFGWLAQFGTIVMLIVFVYIYRLIRDLKYLTNHAKFVYENEKSKIIVSIYDSAKYFIVLYFIISFLSFDWKQPYFLVIFFFFVVYRQLLKKRLAGESQ